MINTKLEKLYLIDSKPELCDKWRQVFSSYPEVEVLTGDYFQQSADAIVSPANSFGIIFICRKYKYLLLISAAGNTEATVIVPY